MNRLSWDEQYERLVEEIYTHGLWTDDNVRTKYADGTPAKYRVKIFEHICLDNSGDEAFLLTTKHVAWKSAVAEIAWIYIMQSNVVQDLRDMNCKVWNEFEKEDGTIGPSYGEIVKRPVFDYKNQLEYVIETIKKDPNSRRIMIDLWSVPDLKDMALTPCCYNSIFNVQNGKLYMQLNIRSSDVALGLPFNVFQFQVLHKLIAHECNLEPADMYVVISNAHYYDRHEKDLLNQTMNPDLRGFPLPKIKIDYPESIWDFKPEMVHIEEYEHGPKIDFEIAI